MLSPAVNVLNKTKKFSFSSNLMLYFLCFVQEDIPFLWNGEAHSSISNSIIQNFPLEQVPFILSYAFPPF
jgi:hypothetical protein